MIGGWHHVVGVLGEDKALRLYLDGKLESEGAAHKLIASDPAQAMEIGTDRQSFVGDYKNAQFSGVIDDVRLYFREATADQIANRFDQGNEIAADAVLAVSFDDGSARDLSLHQNHGSIKRAKPTEGKIGQGIQFTAGKKKGNNQRPGNSLVRPTWTQDLPIYVRAMVLAGQNLFVAGPPDMIDEEETFKQVSLRDPQVEVLLQSQDEALRGDQGGQLLAVNPDTGEVTQQIELPELPTWDGMAAAGGSLYLTTEQGSVVRLGR